MGLYVNNTEVDKLYRNNAAVKKMYANNDLVYEAIKYISKPTISGSFTFDTASHSCTLTGFDANTMTKSGTETATAAGTYTVTVTPKPGCAWALPDGTSDPISLTWNIAKRTLTIPSLSGATTQAFVEGETRSVSVSNFDSTYETQSGTTSSALMGNYSVTWALRYPASTQWSDGTTGNKSGAWSIGWVNGTSHYSNDVYNRGWGLANLEFNPAVSFTKTGEYITVNDGSSGAHVLMAQNSNGTFHAEVYIPTGRGSGSIYETNGSGSYTGTGWSSGTGYTTVKDTWVEIYGAHQSSRPRFGVHAGQAMDGTNGSRIRRIWVT